MTASLHKIERLHKKKQIERMFAGGARSFSLFPLRVIYMPMEDLSCEASILTSVSKRHFKRAVKRNRVKRQIRESYRLNKSVLVDALKAKGIHLSIAFIYLSDELVSSAIIEDRIKIALNRIVERL